MTQTYLTMHTCRYAFFDVFVREYTNDFKDWDMAVITLQQPIGLNTGWMGIKALPPHGACDPGPVDIAPIHTVGYPVEPSTTAYQYISACTLQVHIPLEAWHVLRVFGSL